MKYLDGSKPTPEPKGRPYPIWGTQAFLFPSPRRLARLHMVIWDGSLSQGGLRSMEHRGVRYEIKLAPGGSQWVWIVHASPNPKRGLVEGGPRRVAILAAEKAINRWWQQRHGLDAARAIRANVGSRRSLPE